ncbi:MAG: metallophosphoesterase family protein [Bacteroidota bacterium]
MAALKRIPALLGALLLTAACSHELDTIGMFYTPDTADQRFSESMEYNATHPRTVMAPANSYKIIFTGDSHVGGTVHLEKVLGIAADSSAVCLVIAGDVTTGNEEDYLTASELLGEPRPFDIAVTAGNHDLYFGGWEYFREHFGSSAYALTVNSGTESDLYLFLDSGSGTLGSLQTAWLKEQLANREAYRYVVVVTHLNFFRNRFTSSTNPLNQEVLALLDLFERSKVNLVMMGHDHLRYEDRFGHATYITMDALVDDFPGASYVLVTAGTDGIVYRFEELE